MKDINGDEVTYFPPVAGDYYFYVTDPQEEMRRKSFYIRFEIKPVDIGEIEVEPHRRLDSFLLEKWMRVA